MQPVGRPSKATELRDRDKRPDLVDVLDQKN
jgi:hypothetical protein